MTNRIRVSDNHRFLVRADDGKTPFFYLGDTAWELFHRTTREDADRYLRDRAKKRFTVVQAVALAEFDGLTVPNAYGHVPFKNLDPAQPDEPYWQHVDFIVDRAGALGLTVGMLPSWGDKVHKAWGTGPEIFTPENARVYAEWLGRRYKNKPIIWINGGDRAPAEGEAGKTDVAIWRAIAAGLRAGGGGAHPITFHPMGGGSSADLFHGDKWLDFNMIQSSHGRRDVENWTMVAKDYARNAPAKPCLDAEPPYEDHAVGWKEENGRFDAWDVRKGAYWALFAGAHGHTYGSIDVCLFWRPGLPVFTGGCHQPWDRALDLPGASQVRHARALLESRPFLLRVPDQSLLATPEGSGPNHVQSTRASDGTYAFVYTAGGLPFTVHLDKLAGPNLVASWFDPRTGRAAKIGTLPATGTREFVPPTRNDWVLVLDEAARKFAPPGRATATR